MQRVPRLDHIVKIASRCNLNCSYCYVYNQADTSWRERPAVMSKETFAATVERIRRHTLLSGQQTVTIIFHGGEPTLAGSERFAWMCATARERLADVARVGLAPSGCETCHERDTCAGGHVPNRYSKARGFDNQSVWCADLLALFAHVRMRMGVSPEQTRLRREELLRTRLEHLAVAQSS